MPVERTEVVRIVKQVLTNEYGVVRADRIAGLNPLHLPELDTDPDPPKSGVYLYCTAGEVRARFPTGSTLTLASEE